MRFHSVTIKTHGDDFCLDRPRRSFMCLTDMFLHLYFKIGPYARYNNCSALQYCWYRNDMSQQTRRNSNEANIISFKAHGNLFIYCHGPGKYSNVHSKYFIGVTLYEHYVNQPSTRLLIRAKSKNKHEILASSPLLVESTSGRWIALMKGQHCRRRSHVVTSPLPKIWYTLWFYFCSILPYPYCPRVGAVEVFKHFHLDTIVQKAFKMHFTCLLHCCVQIRLSWIQHVPYSLFWIRPQ